MSKLTSKKIYSGIDLFKLIASLLIVLLHATETQDWLACEVKYVLTRFAVPFFFMVSGFFFYKGLNRAENKKVYFWKYEKNLAKLYLIWALLIYAPFELAVYFTQNTDTGVIQLALIVLRRFLVIGPGPYWYLISLMLAAGVIYFLHQKDKSILLWALIALGFFVQIAFSNFHGLLSQVPFFNYLFRMIVFVYSNEFNFFMYGIPFMGLGYMVSKTNCSVSIKVSTFVFVAATVLRIVEYHLPVWFPSDFWNDNHIMLGFIMQAVAFFMIAKNLNIKVSVSVSLTLRQLSSFIYFSHVIIMYAVIDGFLKQYAVDLVYEPWFIVPKMVLTLIPCVALFTVIKKINNRHLNILING